MKELSLTVVGAIAAGALAAVSSALTVVIVESARVLFSKNGRHWMAVRHQHESWSDMIRESMR